MNTPNDQRESLLDTSPAGHRSFVASSSTSGREPPPTHLADVLSGLLVHSRKGSGLNQLECSTKKLMLRKTKLDEDIPGGSSAESVPTSNELDDAALIAVSSTVGGLVAVTGTPSNGAAIVLLLHGHLKFPEGKRSSRLAVGCFRRWATDPPLDSSSCSV